MKKIYFVKTNASNIVITDDGDVRRVLDNADRFVTAETLESLAESADFDDSSWDIYEEAVDELLDEQCEIIAEFEGNF